MKKIVILMTVIVSLASCKKDDVNPGSNNNEDNNECFSKSELVGKKGKRTDFVDDNLYIFSQDTIKVVYTLDNTTYKYPVEYKSSDSLYIYKSGNKLNGNPEKYKINVINCNQLNLVSNLENFNLERK